MSRGAFTDKVVVVSGASRGIGFAIAKAFAAEGAQTVIAASSQPNLDKAADAIAATGARRPLVVAADLRTLAVQAKRAAVTLLRLSKK